MDYEKAMAFVIELRPRIAAIKADEYARKLQLLVAQDAQSKLELHQIALATPIVMDHLRSDRKIQAIKELRIVAGCGLKEAKDAVERPEVLAKAGMRMTDGGRLEAVLHA